MKARLLLLLTLTFLSCSPTAPKVIEPWWLGRYEVDPERLAAEAKAELSPPAAQVAEALVFGLAHEVRYQVEPGRLVETVAGQARARPCVAVPISEDEVELRPQDGPPLRLQRAPQGLRLEGANTSLPLRPLRPLNS